MSTFAAILLLVAICAALRAYRAVVRVTALKPHVARRALLTAAATPLP